MLVLVADGDLDGGEGIEDVELGEVESRVVVQVVRVLDDDQVEPAAAAGAASGDTDFVANLLELLARLVQQFRGESAAADTGGVGLDDTDDVVDFSRVEAELVMCQGMSLFMGGSSELTPVKTPPRPVFDDVT